MPRPRNAVPTYKLHKSTGLARCWVNGQWVSLGKYGSPESKAEFERVLAELRAGAPAATIATKTAPGVTVDELLVAFMKHAEQHYHRRSDGTPSGQTGEFKAAGKPLHRLYGHTPAAEFGPLALKTVRQEFVTAGICRAIVNSRVGKIKRIWKWAVANELVPVTTYTALTTVTGLQEGRTDARESEPVGPVDPDVVDATVEQLNRQVAGLVRFQQLTGCRPGEATALRRCDIDTSGDVWFFRPVHHKTKHKGKSRAIAIGPKGQELLKAYFPDDSSDFVFSPRRAVEKPGLKLTSRYKRQAYLNAINRACDRAFPLPVPVARTNGETREKWEARLTEEQKAEVKKWREAHRWHPNQLRHAHGTKVRKRFGLEAAQVTLGHAKASVTETYAQRDAALAAKVAVEIG